MLIITKKCRENLTFKEPPSTYSIKIADLNTRCSGLPSAETDHWHEIWCPYISTMQGCFKAPRILISPKQLYSKFLILSAELPCSSKVRTYNTTQDMCKVHHIIFILYPNNHNNLNNKRKVEQVMTIMLNYKPLLQPQLIQICI